MSYAQQQALGKAKNPDPAAPVSTTPPFWFVFFHRLLRLVPSEVFQGDRA